MKNPFSKRLLLALVLAGGLSLTANGQTVTFNVSNVSVQKAMNKFHRQTGYTFVFAADDVDVSRVISVHGNKAKLSNVINQILNGQDVSYTVEGKRIVIKPQPQQQKPTAKPSTPNQGNTKKIKGRVVDEKGEPIVGATVRVKGGSEGTITDVNGNYSLSVPSNSNVEISYVGFTTQQVYVGHKQQLDVTLKEDNTVLNEVVVVGYGTQRKIDLTGSVSTISAKELLEAPMQNVSNLLSGKFSGLTSIQSSGKPGADGTSLFVRGLNSFGSNSPMVIIDGVPGTMDYLNPNDIDNISILKDAAAAIYGVQGANGVILITTKTGGADKAEIEYNGSFSLTDNTAMPKLLNAPDYMYWNNKAREMDGLTPLWTADIQNKVMQNDPNSIWGQTDWMDKIFRTGQTQQHNISASGTTGRIRYYTSLGYMDQEGTLRNTDFSRFNMRTNIDVAVAKNLRFVANVAGVKSRRNWPGVTVDNQSEFNPIRQAINTLPIIKSEFKGYPTAWMNGLYSGNPYYPLYNSGYQRQDRWSIDTNYRLEYDFSGLSDMLKGLKVSLFGAYRYGHTADANFLQYYELYSVNQNGDEGVVGASGYTKGSDFTKSSSWSENWMLRPQIDYQRDFGKHHVAALFLYEKRQDKDNTMSAYRRGFYSNDPVDISLGTEFPEIPATGSHLKTGQASWVGRVNYAFANKYLAEFAFREDGSYVFAPENRWGFFPSGSLGWVISEENFFEKARPVVDFLKLRASIGKSGNDNVTPFLYNSNFGVANNSMILGGNPIAQFYTTNPYIYRDLTWSTTTSYNLGLDADLWNRLLGIELDVFYQVTDNILEDASGNYPPSLGGYFPSYANSGKVDNRGIELTLRHHNRIGKDFSYDITGQFSYARNKVLRRAVTDNYPNYRAQLGQPMNAQYGFHALGLFQTQEEIDNYPVAPSGMIRLGDIKYEDVNGDGIINAQYDYVKIGYGTIPEINYSMNFSFNYKSFYLTMLWQGVDHCDYELSGVYNSGVTASTSYTQVFLENGNTPIYLVKDSWTPEHTNAKYPRLSTVANGNNAWRSDFWLVNGQYLRLKALNIGWNVPEKWLRYTPLTRANIYLAGTNLFTLSHFKYVDPESPSVSNGYYPQQRTFSVGVNITF